MKGIILVNAYYETQATVYQANRMKEEFEKLSVQCDVVKNNGEFCHIKDGKINTLSADFCIYFDKDLYVLEALEKGGVRVFNGYDAVRVCDDKMLTHLALCGVVDMPDTISGTYAYVRVEESEENVDRIEKRFSYPMVLKLNRSSLGAGVFLVKNREELVKKIEECSKEGYLIQEFIKESSGEDLRVIVVGGQCVCAIRRVSKVDFRSNIELGGRGERVEITEEIREFCKKITDKLGLDYCGIDILLKNDKPYLCEVNSNAHFKGIESITGVNVAKAIATHVLGEIQRK